MVKNPLNALLDICAHNVIAIVGTRFLLGFLTIGTYHFILNFNKKIVNTALASTKTSIDGSGGMIIGSKGANSAFPNS